MRNFSVKPNFILIIIGMIFFPTSVAYATEIHATEMVVSPLHETIVGFVEALSPVINVIAVVMAVMGIFHIVVRQDFIHGFVSILTSFVLFFMPEMFEVLGQTMQPSLSDQAIVEEQEESSSFMYILVPIALSIGLFLHTLLYKNSNGNRDIPNAPLSLEELQRNDVSTYSGPSGQSSYTANHAGPSGVSFTTDEEKSPVDISSHSAKNENNNPMAIEPGKRKIILD